ncbi:chitin deacetylase [Haplosporangium sp. Z 767]|nr:chitin deacetylase [Haplosporangium sp. Z 11]KAF9194974.1 chitin deacetylase [Haplosporangium sp. Z 767]
MAPILRLAVVAMLASAAFVNAAPILAPMDSNAAAPALTKTDPSAATPDSWDSELSKRAGVNIIHRCKIPGTVALTFDDGPSGYTNELLDILASKKVKTTFFINGQNSNNIMKHKAVVKRMHKEGHQIASHTWSHQDLATLSVAKITEEMTKLDNAIKEIIGLRPVYMRPPYGSTNTVALDLLGNLGYTIVLWDQDTNDWRHPKDVDASFKVYENALGKANAVSQPGHIFLQHDIHEYTVKKLAGKAIDYALGKGFKVVTVGECLGVSKSRWYRN